MDLSLIHFVIPVWLVKPSPFTFLWDGTYCGLGPFLQFQLASGAVEPGLALIRTLVFGSIGKVSVV